MHTDSSHGEIEPPKNPTLNALWPPWNPRDKKWMEKVDKELLAQGEPRGITTQQEYRIARATALQGRAPSLISLTASLGPAAPFVVLPAAGELGWGPSLAAGIMAVSFPLVGQWLVYFSDSSDAAAAAVIAHRAAHD